MVEAFFFYAVRCLGKRDFRAVFERSVRKSAVLSVWDTMKMQGKGFRVRGGGGGGRYEGVC